MPWQTHETAPKDRPIITLGPDSIDGFDVGDIRNLMEISWYEPSVGRFFAPHTEDHKFKWWTDLPAVPQWLAEKTKPNI